MFKSGNWNETGMIKVNFFLVFTLSGVVVSGKGDDWPTETWLRSQVSTARRSTPHLLPPSSLPLCLSISTEVGEFGGEGCQPPPPQDEGDNLKTNHMKSRTDPWCPPGLGQRVHMRERGREQQKERQSEGDQTREDGKQSAGQDFL